MAITGMSRTDFASAITPIHRDYFTQAYYDEVSKEYEMIVKVEDMGKATETRKHFGGFGMPSSNTEGSTINVDSMSEGYQASYTSSRWDKGYYITHELLTQDLTGVFGGAGLVGKSVVNNAPQQLGKGFAVREEVQAVKLYTDGFGNTGYDGEATFSASHPLTDAAGTASNLVSGALTPTTLKTAITLMRTDSVDEADLISVIRPKYLVVPPALEWVANETLLSQKQAYEFSNTKNSITALEPIVMDYMASTGSTYAATNWFVLSRDVDNFIFGWLERPWFTVQEVAQSPDLFCYGLMNFGTGCVNFRGVVGSTGA